MNEKDVISIRSVFMLTTSFAPEPPGGAERQLEYLSAYLSRQNIHVTIITRHLPSLARYEKKDGYEIIRVPQYGPGKFKTLTFVIGAIFTMLLRRNSFDILHSHLVYSPAFAAVVAGKLIGKKTIVRFRSSGKGSDLVKSNKSWRGLIRMAVLKRWADCYVVLTDEMKDELIVSGYESERIVRMNNGVDTDYFSPAKAGEKVVQRHVESIPSDKILLLYTGRFDPSKNLPLLLRATKKALDQCSNLHLILVGDGEEKERLVSLAGQLNIQANVTFVDSTPNVREYLRKADIFVMSSSDEGISNSLLEAMSCGLACISTNVGGANELLSGGLCGILVDPNNENELSDSIVRLALDPVTIKHYGGMARQRVVDNYSIASVGDGYINLYNSIVNRR